MQVPSMPEVTEDGFMDAYRDNPKVDNRGKVQHANLTKAQVSSHASWLDRVGHSPLVERLVQDNVEVANGIISVLNATPIDYSAMSMLSRFNTSIGQGIGFGLEMGAFALAEMAIAENLLQGSAKLISRVGGLWGKGEVLAKEPVSRSLSNVEARKWYHEQLAKIPEKIDKRLPLREQSLQAFKLRNEIKLRARELMADQELAQKLMNEQPVKTLKDVSITAYKKHNLVGDDFWKYINGSSQRSNRIVDENLGFHRDYNSSFQEPRP